MDSYYFTFQSMTHAQSAVLMLQSYGLAAVFLRAPKAISVTGCGYAVKVGISDGKKAGFLLQNAGIIPKKVFIAVGSGEIREVLL